MSDPAGPVPEEGLSDAAAFPGAAYAPYPNRSHAWNPRGTGVDRRRIDVPVMLLSGSAAADAQRRASGNAVQVWQQAGCWLQGLGSGACLQSGGAAGTHLGTILQSCRCEGLQPERRHGSHHILLQGFEGAVQYAELQATMHGARNSSACIAGAACLPLGSHSVWCAGLCSPAIICRTMRASGHHAWQPYRFEAAFNPAMIYVLSLAAVCYRAALPPLLPPGTREGAASGERQQPLPITLVVASVNGGGLFHDSIVVRPTCLI